ncbi:hypothetical protein SDC9_166497 [bioreactor metagenome]|uniref:Uncharacterized protein n=1 Tax=bioreactor metagenome TaxID=1076179 RepID=A0A645FX33_9ZZZZ
MALMTKSFPLTFTVLGLGYPLLFVQDRSPRLVTAGINVAPSLPLTTLTQSVPFRVYAIPPDTVLIALISVLATLEPSSVST